MRLQIITRELMSCLDAAIGQYALRCLRVRSRRAQEPDTLDEGVQRRRHAMLAVIHLDLQWRERRYRTPAHITTPATLPSSQMCVVVFRPSLTLSASRRT